MRYCIPEKRDELLSKSKPADWGVLDKDDVSKEARKLAQMALVKAMLKDPDSAKFGFQEPTRGTDIVNGEAVLVWYASMYVNAKNSFGGYVGDRRYAFQYKCIPNSKEQCKMINIGVPDSKYPDQLDWQL